MTDELANSAAPRLAVKAGRTGWRGPLRSPSERPPTPLDEEYAAVEKELADAIAVTEAAKESVFAAREALPAARRNGDLAEAEERLADAHRSWEAASVVESKLRVRLTSLGLARNDWRRGRALEELGS